MTNTYSDVTYHKVPYRELTWQYTSTLNFIQGSLIRAFGEYKDDDPKVFILKVLDHSVKDNSVIRYKILPNPFKSDIFDETNYDDLECMDSIHDSIELATIAVDNEIKTRNRKIKIANILRDE